MCSTLLLNASIEVGAESVRAFLMGMNDDVEKVIKNKNQISSGRRTRNNNTIV